MHDEIRFLSVCGMLGYGYPLESLERGMAAGVAFVGADNGSTDPGPYYLGEGQGFVQPMQIRRDLEPALAAARQAGVPLVVGSAGGSGARAHVDAFVAILLDIAHRRDLHFRLAVIYADVAPETVRAAVHAGRVAPCQNVPELTEARIDACTRIVAQMGTDPIVEALAGGADVVVVGRCCDTAIFAALPIMKGFDAGLALHAAKIAECGALCAVPVGANDALVATVGRDCFRVEPANPARRCTPDSVAAHSLYEQPDPTCFYEPEGQVDLSACRFEAHGERAVRVTGTRLVAPAKPCVKLEGAELKGYRTITVAGLSDPRAIERLADIEQGVREAVAANSRSLLGPDDYTLRFLRYGLDGVTGRPAPARPHEVGLVIEAIAPTQELADAVLSLARSTALHQPFAGRKATAGNLAFPFSPSDLHGGPVYEFAIYHLMETPAPGLAFPVHFEDV